MNFIWVALDSDHGLYVKLFYKSFYYDLNSSKAFYFCENFEFMEWISQTWHWSVSGFLIGMSMLILIYFGKSFGMSSNLRTLCSMTGVGKKFSFFDWDWRSQRWNLVVVFGAMIGGWIAINVLSSPENVNINPATVERLASQGITVTQGDFLPESLFESSQPSIIFFLIIGGFLIGFGSRYAGGCTSGHAISGLSNLQMPSLKAVIGFFIGGLLMVHLILPIIFKMILT